MAHELELKQDGKASMFSGEGITPWHQLGTVVEGLATAEEALTLAGLDWDVSKEPVFQKVGDSFVQVPNRFSTVRSSDSKSLGIVSDNYHVFQNSDAFKFLNSITSTGSKDAVFSTAGALFGGSRVFITLKIGDAFMVGDKDAHDLYLMVTNSHDGSQAFTASITAIRAVCNNTVTLGLASARTKWSIRHKSTLEGNILNAREALEMSFRYESGFEEAVQNMLDIDIVKDQFFSIVDKIVPASKTQHDKDVEALMGVWESEETSKMGGAEGTGWQAFNAITYWLDHEKSYRSPESRFNSIIGSGLGTGAGEKMRPAAQKAILAFA